MKKLERYSRGARLLEDAWFVKENMIDLAYRAEKWNIVVFDPYRSAELLIKGIVFSAGYEPKQTHGLDSLVRQLSRILKKEKDTFPVNYKFIVDNLNGYLLHRAGDGVELLKRVSGAYSMLGCRFHLQNKYLPPRLVRNNPGTLSMYQDKTEIFRVDDWGFSTETNRSMSFPLQSPDKDRLAKLEEITDILLSTRTQSFYREREFGQGDAEESVQRLSTVFELSKAFEVCERINTGQ